MKNTNTTILVVLIAAVVLVGGGVIYSLNLSERAEPTTTGGQDSQTSDQAAKPDEPAEGQVSTDSSDSQVIDGVDIPSSVLADIERDYPDYIIDDADREVRGGEVYYEIELDHRESGNESEYELTYNADWELISTEHDRD